jgi:hypothetical protein
MIKATVLLVDIPNIRPYGWAPRPGRSGTKDTTVQGHEFDFMVELKFSKKFGLSDGLEFDTAALSWGERIRWYTPDPYPGDVAAPESYTDTLGRQPGLKWKFVHEDIVDFAAADRRTSVKTVQGGWFGASFEPAWWDPWKDRFWRDAFEPLLTGPSPIDFAAIEQKQKGKQKGNDQKAQMKTAKETTKAIELAVAKHFQSSGTTLKTYMTDRPGLTKLSSKDDGSLQNTGGGGMATVARKTRRRVVHFNLGLTSLGKMATATQVLETVGGIPTINKFMVPGCSILESEDVALLAKWRRELDTSNINNFTLGK